jgi:hypothetical protein
MVKQLTRAISFVQMKILRGELGALFSAPRLQQERCRPGAKSTFASDLQSASLLTNLLP